MAGVGGVDSMQDSYITDRQSDIWSAMIQIGALLSIAGCTTVCIVIWVYRKYSASQAERIIWWLAIANLGYSVFWLLPRYSHMNWAPEDVGGCDEKCKKGTICFSITCYTEAVMQLFSLSCVLWEAVLILYTSYCIRANRSVVAPWAENAAHAVCWLPPLGLALYYLYECLDAYDEDRLNVAKTYNENFVYVWFGLVGPTALGCIWVNVVIVRRQHALIHSEYRKVLSINRGYISRTGRINRATLVNLQKSILKTAVIPLRAYSIAFFVLAAPQVAYLVWDLHDRQPDTRRKVMIKSASFLILALRGFAVTCIYFWNTENKHQLHPTAFLRQLRKTLRNKNVKFGEDQIESLDEWTAVDRHGDGEYTFEQCHSAMSPHINGAEEGRENGIGAESSSPTDPHHIGYGSPARSGGRAMARSVTPKPGRGFALAAGEPSPSSDQDYFEAGGPHESDAESVIRPLLSPAR